MLYTTIDSPLGELLLLGDGAALHGLAMQAGSKPRTVHPGWQWEPTAFTAEVRQLHEYFNGERMSFELELEPRGTLFQRRVWDALLQIAYGETMTYGELAGRIGSPTAARAVGAANGANPIAVIIPCHRLVGASGALTGYAGGVDRKRALLELEAARDYATAGRWRRQVKPAIEPTISVGTIVSAR